MRDRFDRQGIRVAAIAALVTGGLASLSGAAVWKNPAADAVFGNGANWDTSPVAPGTVGTFASTDTVNFGSSTLYGITVDAGRNVQNFNFTSTSSGTTYTFTGGPFNLTAGGSIQEATGALSQNFSTGLVLGGDYTIANDITASTNRIITINSSTATPSIGVNGTATAGNLQTLTLRGVNGGSNIFNAPITDGTGGGKLAVSKQDGGFWIVANTGNAYTGGTTAGGGTIRSGGSGNSSTMFGTGPFTIAGGFVRFQGSSSTTVNNDVAVTAPGGGFSFRANSFFAPATLTGTSTLNLTGDSGVVLTPADFKGFAGTIAVQGFTSGFTVRQATAFANASMANAALDLGSLTFLTRQTAPSAGTTATIDIGRLSGVGTIGNGAAVTSTASIIYSVGGRNEDSTFGGAIRNDIATNVGLTKVGNAALILSGTNAYSGPTTVSGGRLLVDGSIVSPVTVATAGKFGGTGSVFSLGVDGTLAPGGNALGDTDAILDVASTLNLNPTGANLSTTNLDIDGTVAEVSFDQLRLATGATLIYGGTLNLDFTGFAPELATYDLFSFSTAAAGSFVAVNLTGSYTGNLLETTPGSGIFTGTTGPADNARTFTFVQSTGDLMVIPEPATLASLGLVSLLLRRRR